MKTILWSTVRKQKKQIWAGTSLSLILLVLAGLVWLPSGKDQSVQLTPEQVVAQKACLGAWSGIRDGFVAFPLGSKIKVSHQMTSDPRQLLSESSLGIVLCHSHYKLQSFCMGTDCKIPGLTLILSQRTETNFGHK